MARFTGRVLTKLPEPWNISVTRDAEIDSDVYNSEDIYMTVFIKTEFLDGKEYDGYRYLVNLSNPTFVEDAIASAVYDFATLVGAAGATDPFDLIDTVDAPASPITPV